VLWGLLVVEDHHPEGGLADAVAEVFDGTLHRRCAGSEYAACPAQRRPRSSLALPGLMQMPSSNRSLLGSLRATPDGNVEASSHLIEARRSGDVLFVAAATIHAAKNVGSVNAAELSTHVVEKGKPLVELAK
jgi:hypothetical protein